MKPTHPQHRPLSVSAAVSAILSLAASGVHAGPQNGVVTAGQATISTPDANLTQIDQASQNVSINWDSFDVAAQERVNFTQPSSDAVALNRILSQDPSLILGSITANGRVFLLNPNGMIFGQSARVNVGSLVASSLDVADADDGRYAFSSAGARRGDVVNQGQLMAADGGSVTLLGESVRNAGVIVADYGTVNLGAGRAATLHFDGDGLVRFQIDAGVAGDGAGAGAAVTNDGEIAAPGGQVLLTARQVGDVLAQTVNNSGVIRASRIDNSGGRIQLLGTGGEVVNSGTLDAAAADAASNGGEVQVLGEQVLLTGSSVVDVSGSTGGGTALIGGSFGGSDPAIPSARETRVLSGAEIHADSTLGGDAGQVSVWADGTTRFSGTVFARAQGADGDGGFVEISGREHLGIDGHAWLQSQHGRSGTLLLDPGSVTIEHDDAGAGPGAELDVFTDSWINTQLDGSGLSILTSASLNDGTEDLAVEADVHIEWVDADHTLTLSGGNSVSLLAGSRIEGAGALVLQSGGNVAIGSDVVLGGNLTVTAGGPITQEGSLDVGGVAQLQTRNDAGAAITLDGTNNFGSISASVRNTVNTANATAAITIHEAGSTVLGDVGTVGSFDIVSGGAITQSGALSVGGVANFRTRDDAGAAITLDGTNNFGTVHASTRNAENTANAPAAITIREASSTVLGNVATGGTLDIVSGGAITQSGTLTVGDSASFRTLNTAGAAITLDGTNNFGSVHASVRDADDTINAAAAITIHEAGSTELGDVGTDGTLSVESRGAIMQSGALVVGDAASFRTLNTAGAAITLDGTNNFGSVHASVRNAANTSDAIAAVTIHEAGNTLLGNVTTSGTLDVSSGGSITQSSALTAGSNASFHAGAGASILLDNAANTFGATVGLTSAGTLQNVTIADSTALQLQPLTLVGDLDVRAASITQAGALSIGGAASFTANAGQSITLTENNAFNGAVSFAAGGGGGLQNVSVTNLSGLALQLPALSGDLAVVAGGPITQVSALNVGGAASFRTLNDTGAAITLSGANNFGTVHASVRDADNDANAAASITINEASGTELGAVGTLGALTVTSGGSITQSGAIAASGNAAFHAGAGASIVLGNAANAFGGTIGLTSAGMLQNVTIADSTTLQLPALTLAGDLNVRGASITQSGALTVAGASTFTANAGQSITLTQDNAFTGAVSLAAASGGSLQNVRITDQSALALQLPAMTGDLTVVAGGPITQLSALNVGGSASFRTRNDAGAAITLDGTNNFGTFHASVRNAGDTANAAAAITLREAGSIVLGDVNTGGTLGVISAGAITQSGALDVDGAASFRTLSNAGAAITLDGTNSFGTLHASVRNTDDNANVSAAITLRESDGTMLGNVGTGATLDVISGGAITQSGGLTVGGEARFRTLNNAGAAITLDGTNNFGSVHASVRNAADAANAAATITIREAGSTTLGTVGTAGDLQVTSGGSISQSGALTIGGASIFSAADGGSILLGNTANALAGAVTLASGGTLQNVTIADTTALDLHALTLAGNLDVRASSITQSGALDIDGTARFTAAGGQSLQLLDAGNTFSGTVTLAAISGSLLDAGIHSLGGLRLAGGNLAGNLVAVSDGDITQGGALTISGNSSFTVGAGQSVLLGDAANSFGGAVQLAAAGGGTLQDVNIADTTVLDLAALSLTGDLAVTALSITQSGALDVNGATSFTAGAGQSIHLGHAGNDFTGAINFAATGGGSLADLTFFDRSAVDLSALTLTGNLNVATGSAITQSGVLDVAGAARFRTLNDVGAAITLAGANSFGTLHAASRNAADTANAAGAIILHEAGSTSLGDVDTAAGAAISSAGAISRVAGTDITAASLLLTAGNDIGSAAAPIVLAGVDTILSAMAPGNLHIQDSGTLRLANIQAGGIAAISADGSILADSSASTISADALVLQAAGAIGQAQGSGAGPLQLQVQSVAATANGGGVYLDAGSGDLVLRQIAAAGPVWLRATSGSLVDDADDPAVAAITSNAGGVHLRARDNIGTVTDVATRQGAALLVDTGSGELTAQVSSTTGQVNLLFDTGDAPTLGAGAISAGGDGRLLLHSPGDLSLGGLAGAITGFSQAGLSSDAVLGLAPGLIGGVSDVLLLHGGADITGAGRAVDVSAGHLVFTSGGQGGDFTLNTAVDRLDATIGGGASLTVNNSTALTVGALGAGGNLSITAADILDDGDAGSMTRLTAGGTLSLTSQAGIGRADDASGGRIDTAGATLVLQANAGSVFVSNLGDLQVSGRATGGSVDIAAPSGSITVQGALQASGALTLVAGTDATPGNILLNATAQAGQAANLTALGGGNISDAGAGLYLVAADARLVAGSIGIAGNALDASLTSLEATGTTALHVNLSGGTQLREIVAPVVSINASGSLIDDGNAASRISGTDVRLSGASIGAPGSAIGTAAGNLSLTATSGGIHIDELDAVTLADVRTAGAGNDITILAGGAIDAASMARIEGAHLTLAGTSIGSEANPLQSQVSALTATAAGGLFINEVDGLLLNAISAEHMQIRAGGALTDDGNDTTRLAATTVVLAGESVGTADSRIDTAADILVIEAGSGGAFVDELDAVSLAGVTVTGGGTFAMRANGAISDADSTLVAAGQVTLSGASIGATDNSVDTVTGALTATATSGDLFLHNSSTLLRVDGLSAPGAIDVRTTGALLQSGAINSAGSAISIHAAEIAADAGATTQSGGGNITYVAEAGDATIGVIDAGAGRALVLARDGVYSVLDPATGLYNLTGSLIEVRAGGLGAPGQIGTAVNPMGINATDLGPRSVYLIVPAENGAQKTTPQVNLAGVPGALLVKGYVGTTGALLFDLSTAFTPEAVVQGAESIVVLLNGRAAVNTDSLSAASQALSSGVVARTNVDWSAFDPDVSLFSTVGPSVRLPDDQVDEALGQ